MHGSEVERKKRQQEFNSDIISVHMLLTTYSVAETDDVCMVVKWRGRKDNRSSILILLVCICYLPPTVWQRQMMCGSEVERKKKDNRSSIQQH